MKICTFVIGWPISYNIGTPDNKEVILQHRKEVAMNITERKMLNSKQVAEILGISVSYAYKVIDQLNKELNDVMNSCATYEDLVAVVDEIAILLSTDPEVDLSKQKWVKLKDCIENGVIAKDLTALRDYLERATSTEIIKYLDEKSDEEKELVWQDPVTKVCEPYVYYDSLYGLYNQWMTKYGFLPAEK